MGQKPFAAKNGAQNLIRHGAGALNIDGCRVDAEKPTGWSGAAAEGDTWNEGNSGLCKEGEARPVLGRWPANLIHDGSDEVVAAFPDTKSGELLPHHAASGKSQLGTFNIRDRDGEHHPTYGDSGSAARFFYSAKADADDRIGSKHPTVKPVDLMRYLVRLVTPKGGTVLDPFSGTGTTGEAAFYEGFNAILIEREDEYVGDIKARMALCLAGPDERKREIAKRKDEPTDALPLFAEPQAERAAE
ncbi:MAG: site-specific DNA-methyltransferase [Pseudomonadota bacterium]